MKSITTARRQGFVASLTVATVITAAAGCAPAKTTPQARAVQITSPGEAERAMAFVSVPGSGPDDGVFGAPVKTKTGQLVFVAYAEVPMPLTVRVQSTDLGAKSVAGSIISCAPAKASDARGVSGEVFAVALRTPKLVSWFATGSPRPSGFATAVTPYDRTSAGLVGGNVTWPVGTPTMHDGVAMLEGDKLVAEAAGASGTDSVDGKELAHIANSRAISPQYCP